MVLEQIQKMHKVYLELTGLAVTRKAQAEIENVRTIYAELPVGGDGLFRKAGYTMFDLNTLENAITSSGTYGNTTDVDGYVVGVGIKKDYARS